VHRQPPRLGQSDTDQPDDHSTDGNLYCNTYCRDLCRCDLPVSGHCKPLPTVNAVTNVTYCNGDAANAINFGSNLAGATFAWTSTVDVGFEHPVQ